MLIANINLEVRRNLNCQIERADDGLIISGPDSSGKRLKLLFKEDEEGYPDNAKAQFDEFVNNANTLMQQHYQNYQDHYDKAVKNADQQFKDFKKQLDIEKV